MMKSLNTLSLGKTGTIQKLAVPISMRHRLLDLGFIPGSNITPIYHSVLGNPTAYSIRGIIIALRKEDAQKIFIQ